MEILDMRFFAQQHTLARIMLVFVAAATLSLSSSFIFPNTALAATSQADCDSENGAGKTIYEVSTDGAIGSCRPIDSSQAAAYDRAYNIQRSACSLWSGSWSFSSCIWGPFLNGVGSLFLSLGATILGLAGMLFDTLISYIVIAFGQTIRDLNILDAINQGWTVFRDFSNILIIGFFVFIAISIILGLSEFGQKRLIANVLVIAVLMNFSLLFTKLIIDGSNFVAYQIYAQMANASGAQASQFKIVDGFLEPMKIGSVWNTNELLKRVATQTNSDFQALAYGVVGGIMLFAVALVLFYGSFLIAWRGVLFIFLMLTAPLAFASYLVPTLAKGEYGWSSWWKMLINNAAFGPLLMIMLALSLAIIKAAGSRAGTPFGEIISDPTNLAATAWVTVLVYIIGIGLLFVSMKVASNFATSIGGGYGFATGLSKLIGLAPLAGATSLAGWGLRSRLGGRAAFKSLELDDSIEKQRAAVRLAPNDALRFQENQKLMSLIKQKGAADKTARREFNFDNTALGKALIKSGMPALAGDTKGGFAEPRKKAAEEAAKAGGAVVVSNKQAEEIARATMDQQQETAKRSAEEQKSTNEQLVKAAQSVAESVKHSEGLHQQRDEAFKAAAIATQNKATTEEEHKAGKISDSKREEIMREQEQKITEANEKIREANVRMRSIDKEHLEAPHIKMAEQKVKDASERLRDLEIAHKAGVKDLKGKVVEASINDAASILAGINHADSYTAAHISKKLRASNKDSRIKDQLRVLRSLDDESSAKPADSGTPTA